MDNPLSLVLVAALDGSDVIARAWDTLFSLVIAAAFCAVAIGDTYLQR